MPSLIDKVSFERSSAAAEGTLILLHSLDHVLFEPERCGFPRPWDEDDTFIWCKTQATLRDAKWHVSMAGVLSTPGMRG